MAILIVIAVSGLTLQQYLDQTAESLSRQLYSIKTTVEAEDWPSSQRFFSDMMRRWQQTRANWALFIDHFELDSIETRLARIREMLALKDRQSAITELGETIMLLQHVPDRERLTWRNLL